MKQAEMERMEKRIYEYFSALVDVPSEALINEKMTLATLITRSSNIHNSVDLMDAFAKTANMLRKEFGVKIRLPAFPGDTAVADVVAALLAEVAKAPAAGASQNTALHARHAG